MKSHVILLLVMTLAGTIVGVSQTSSDLQRKYGPPDALGRYIVRPGVGMTVRVNEKGITTEMTVRPIRQATDLADRKAEGAPVIKRDVAHAILSEIAPVAKRGRYKGTGNAEFGCTSVDHLDYEKALISISYRCSQQGGGTYSINVRWKT